MDNYADFRWTRLEGIINDFEYIKDIVRKKFNYEVKESSIKEFKKNIKNYKTINELVLLSLVEEYSYKKLTILTMRKLKKIPQHPVYEELSNPAFKQLFKINNKIFMENDKEYSGELDSCFKVVKYNEIDNKVIIKLACIKECTYMDVIEDGIQCERLSCDYDFCKFIIDLDTQLIYMFYNDVNSSNNNGKDVTEKKTIFYSLFKKATRGNILSYDISRELNNYFLDYINEVNENDPKKLISEIESSNLLGPRNSLKSIDHNCKHNKLRLEAITNAINGEGHYISTIESTVNSKLYRIKASAEIIAETSFFSKEGLNSVFQEFFKNDKINIFKI